MSGRVTAMAAGEHMVGNEECGSGGCDANGGNRGCGVDWSTGGCDVGRRTRGSNVGGGIGD